MVTKSRGNLISVHIADLHFGAFDAQIQYNILHEQFIQKIWTLPVIDIIAIDGDIFDHKLLANSDAIMYAGKFMQEVVDIAKVKKSTIVYTVGTYSHEQGQQKIFYHYFADQDVDFRIIESIQFIDVKGAKILCIPELYGIDESVYKHFFFESGWYDEAFIHGTFKGAVYGDLVTGNGRLFVPEDFIYCRGYVISGHVHNSGCFNGFYYYCGCPYRWRFGEEEDKGFLLTIHDLDTHITHVQFEPIISFKYSTIYLDQLVSEDPKLIIDYINNLKNTQGVDFIKVRFRVPIPGYNQTIINNYYRNNRNSFVEFMDLKEIEEQKIEEQQSLSSKYDYFMDNSLSDMEKFVRYINDSEGYQFITIDKLVDILNEKI